MHDSRGRGAGQGTLPPTLEDPTFLTRPFKYAFMWSKRQGGLNPVWVTCDPETSRSEVDYAYPGNKYMETGK